MSMRKMRLVSDLLYSKLMSENPDPTVNLVAEKNAILQSKNIPDEIKPQLYHQAIRKIADREREEDEKPLELNLRTNFTKPHEKYRRQLLETFFAINNVRKGNNGQLIVDGTVHASTPYDRVVNRLLGNTADRTTLAGFKAVTDKMASKGMPQTYFQAKQWGGCMKKKVQKPIVVKKSGNKIAKKNVHKPKIVWKSY